MITTQAMQQWRRSTSPRRSIRRADRSTGMSTKKGRPAPQGTDIWAVSNGYVSVTPMKIGETDPSQMDSLRAIFKIAHAHCSHTLLIALRSRRLHPAQPTQRRSSERRPDHHRRCGVWRHRQLRRAGHQDAEHRQPREERDAADRLLRRAELLADARGSSAAAISSDSGSRTRSARRARRGEQGLPATGRTLPQLLKNNGYRTGADRQVAPRLQAGVQPERARLRLLLRLQERLIDYYQHTDQTGEPRPVRERRADARHRLLDRPVHRALGQVHRAERRQPFFLEVAYNAAHWPFQVPDHPSVAPDNARFVQPQDDPTEHAAGLRRDPGAGGSGRRADSRDARAPWADAQHARDLHQGQRRRVAVAQRAALPSQEHRVGRRHPRAGDLPVAGTNPCRQDVGAGRHHDGSHRDDPRRDQLAGAGRGEARRHQPAAAASGRRAANGAHALLAVTVRRDASAPCGRETGSCCSTAAIRCSSTWPTTSASATISRISARTSSGSCFR